MSKGKPSRVEDSLLFVLPFTANPARLDNPELGLTRMLALAGRSAAHAAEVTVLDVSDHRLIRSGIELFHRVVDGRGDWRLRSRGWEPALSGDLTVPFAHGDLPGELADLVLPFRRRGTLGPIAAVSYQRQTFEFRSDADDQPCGWLRDSKATVRRGGVTTARYREIVIEPGPAGLTLEQADWLGGSLLAVGGTRVESFPSLAARLGTPATGLSDYPEPRPVGPDSTFENFVESMLDGRLRELIMADLAARTDAPGADDLIEIVGGLRAELTGLAPTLDPDWLAELTDELDWLVGALAETSGEPDRLQSLLRRERYLRLLDLLVTGSRAPKVDEERTDQASAETLVWLLGEGVDRLLTTLRELSPASRDADWAAAARQAIGVRRLERVSRSVLPKRSRRTAKKLRPLAEQLIIARDAGESAAEAQRQSRFATPAEAFDLGRVHEREQQRQHAAQQQFLQLWADLSEKRR